MPGHHLPDLTSIDHVALVNALRDLRTRKREPRGAILQLAAVTDGLRRAGLRDGHAERAEMLRKLLRDLTWTGLCQARGQVNGSRPPMDADHFPADPAADFRGDHVVKQAWSAVWYRYLSDEAPSIDVLQQVASVARTTFWRRQSEGVALLTQALKAAELEARRGLPGPDVPPPLSPDAAQRAEAEAILQRVKAALAADLPDALALEAAERRLILGRSWDSLDLYRLRQALLWSDERYQLDERFVDLTLLIDLGEDAPTERWRLQERRYQSLDAALAEQPDPAFVVLGAPGAGKSTLLRHHELGMMLDGLRGATERISVFVPLSRYGSQDDDFAAPPLTWLASGWAAEHPDLPPMPTLLAEQRVTLLLDAVNEMPHRNADGYLARVGRWQAFVADLAARLPGNRVVFSCRSLDYSAPLSSKDLAVPQLRIEPLDDAKVQSFLDAYCPTQAREVWASLKDQPQLGLLRTPFLLRMLALQAERHRRPPTGRAALFSSFIRGALRNEVQGGNPRFETGLLVTLRDRQRIVDNRQWPRPFDLPGAGLFPPLADLAYAMQDQRGSTEAAQIRLPYEQALDSLEAALPVEQAEAVLLAGCDLGILDQDRGRDELLFRHQLLQEYFAARKLAAAPHAELATSEWRADCISPTVAELIATLPPAEPLPPLSATGWEETMLLAGAMTADQDAFAEQLADNNLPLAGRCAAQPESKVTEPVKERLRWALVNRSRDAKADLRARIAAGEALGELGDPRFKRCVSAAGVEYLMPPMVRVPGGQYWIGSDEGNYPDVLPRQQVDVDEFWIGQFPVTNAEYACFIKAGGYEEERWWVGEAAQRWWRGEGTDDANRAQDHEWRRRFLDDPLLLDRMLADGEASQSSHQRWTTWIRYDDRRFEQFLASRYPDGCKRLPDRWHRITGPDGCRPIVGISWFESLAFTQWLTALTSVTFTVPDELAWEAAAAGPSGQCFPFGEDFNVDAANNAALHLGRTTPIGIFAAGDSPCGASDLSGNVLEWTLSPALEEPARATTPPGTRAALAANSRAAAYIKRNREWLASGDTLRTSLRRAFPPSHRVIDTGFRLAARLPLDHYHGASQCI
ncbi:MAG: SUMF1/EgtB/PvdO family nonheme iron enzyme [Ardenticatenia bacterium]|nr:SUMF1/EgtB/PvdO family nonheme iron enzyme [Ardenticatenia bacterium]